MKSHAAGREYISKELLEKIDGSTEENGYFLHDLPIGTKLTIQTRNTKYDVEIRKRAVLHKDWLDVEVWMKGHHLYCPELIRVEFRGSTFGASMMKLRWVGVDMHMEFVVPEHPEHGVITTSAIAQITRRD